jgi:S1-C subfamily serine protease
VTRRPTPVIVHLSGHLRGTTRRLAGERLRIGTAFEDPIRVMPHELPPGEADGAPGGHLATLELRDDSYELIAAPGAEVWVNGKLVRRALLRSGDLLEIGEGGPVLRYRLYRPGSRAYKSMAEAYSDCRDCARHGARGFVERSWVRLTGTPLELATQTAPGVRVLLALAVLLLLIVAVLGYRNVGLERRLAAEHARVEGLSELLQHAEARSFSAEDLSRLSTNVDRRLGSALERVEALEGRLDSRRHVISDAARSVVFLQGAYGFVDEKSGRPLRFIVSDEKRVDELPVMVTLEGDGPLVEVLYTGTGFLADLAGSLLTNRHVALPWEFDELALEVIRQGFRPEMRAFKGYLPGSPRPFTVQLVRASDVADVALLRCDPVAAGVPPLSLAELAPEAGDEVIVLGYPAGMQALLARADPEFVGSLMENGPLGFWELAEELAAVDAIAPLATVGIVGQITPGSIVYDAETTHGGSGGPVLNLDGRVVAVNAAVLPEFDGSNLGVPAARAAELFVTGPAPPEGADEADGADPSADGSELSR